MCNQKPAKALGKSIASLDQNRKKRTRGCVNSGGPVVAATTSAASDSDNDFLESGNGGRGKRKTVKKDRNSNGSAAKSNGQVSKVRCSLLLFY